VLDDFISEPRLVEIDRADVAAVPARVDEVARELDFGASPLVYALFAMRTIPERIAGGSIEPLRLRLADIGRSGHGFAVLAEVPGHSLTVGAIGRFWETEIEFLDVPTDRFAAFAEPGWGKLAWEIRFEPLGERSTRVEFELRISATDDVSWAKLRRYYRLISPFSHFIRRHVLGMLQRELDTPEHVETTRPLPGDELLPQQAMRVTHGITIAAPPEKIWPWLVQMGCGRAGWYSRDALDNAGRASARTIVAELQRLELGQVLPATPEGEDGFTVLALEPERFLVLGGAFDRAANQSVEFFGPLPEHYWRVTWAFVLEPLDAGHTRLMVRASVDFAPTTVGLRLLWMRPIHRFMQMAQLRRLAARAEGTLPHHDDGPRDVGEGIVGAASMLIAFATPFLRRGRTHWGISEDLAKRDYPGDTFIETPRWQWTHGIEIDAPPSAVWPWIAQIGRDKAGFYSYQFLENVVGCDVQNAENLVEDWQHPQIGDELQLHPDMPGLPIRAIEEGHWLLAESAPAPDPSAPSWVRASWLFWVEPIDGGKRSRFISRYRCGTSDDWKTRLQFGPTIAEPIGFVMDRRMLLGVKERAEAHAKAKVKLRD